MAKKYIITVSNYFPKGHIDAGEETGFVEKIDAGVKIHTIRKNFSYWSKIADKIRNGDGELEIRTWAGRPYHDKQITQFKLSTVGIQKIEMDSTGQIFIDGEESYVELEEIAKNDGLTLAQFESWFADHDWTEPAAIIHFTDFRYTNKN